jgi:very-short-patch-repair endonuclease
MTRIYNKKVYKEKRRVLRKNMTKAEVLLWLELKNRKILGQRFLRQYGVLSYVVDNYCPKVKLAVEVDGATHQSEEEIEYDKIRQEKLEQYGITFLRFTNAEVYDDRYNIVEKIKMKVKEMIEAVDV